MKLSSLTISLLLVIVSKSTSLNPEIFHSKKMLQRKSFLQGTAMLGALIMNPTSAFSVGDPRPLTQAAHAAISPTTKSTVAYRSLSLSMGDQFSNTNVPVACWYPCDGEDDTTPTSTNPTFYPHRISVRRIGQMLAGWNFIPNFVSRDFALQPTMVINSNTNVPLPAKAPIVLLAHGYLGSRFDLSHLAEALAAEGFVCLAPEYPESLAASYERLPGLDRTIITQQLLGMLEQTTRATSYGVIGHSLGCGTALRIGDDTWTRVLVSGYNGARVPGNVLILSSMNDGVLSMSKRGLAIPSDITLLNEQSIDTSLPSRAALIFDGADAPNHISFLAEGVNDAMVDFLSPLLPVAQAMSIPVLDFDRYQVSRDSIATANVVRPLVTQYLKQHMKRT